MPLAMELVWGLALLGTLITLAALVLPKRQPQRLTPEQERIPLFKPPGKP